MVYFVILIVVSAGWALIRRGRNQAATTVNA
jgi:hypothetical protein